MINTDMAEEAQPSSTTESSNDVRIRGLRQQFQDLISNIPKADQLDVMFITADFAMGMFNHGGGYLDIPNTSVQLYIPPGALTDGSHQEVYIYMHHGSGDGEEDQEENGVNQDQDDSVKKGSNTPVSPTIRCGPPGLQFKPDIFGVVLSFPSVHNGKDINVVTKNSGDSHWNNVTNESNERCIAGSDGNVHLMINHFSDFKTEKIAGDGEAIASGGKETGLRIAAFGRPLQPKQHIFQCYLCAWDSSSEKKVRLLESVGSWLCLYVSNTGWFLSNVIYSKEKKHGNHGNFDHSIYLLQIPILMCT